MRKRSEAKKAPASERTEAIPFHDPDTQMRCNLCEESALLRDAIKGANGILECSFCGAALTGTNGNGTVIAEGAPKGFSTPNYTGTKCSVCGLPQVKTPSGDVCAKGHGGAAPLAEGAIPEEQERATASAQNVDVNDGPPKDEEDIPFPEPPKVPREKVTPEEVIQGTKKAPEWSTGMVPDQVRYSPTKAPIGEAAAPHDRKTTLYVSRGRHTFPTAPYGSFHVGPFNVSVEVDSNTDLVKISREIRAQLRKMADEAFQEELAWYEEKFEKVKGEG